MDSKFEVFYFPIKGRAELVRLLLVAAKANWESKGVTDWPKEKFSTEGLLYKQVPMLIEHKSNGKELRLVQTGAIVRYIANKFSKFFFFFFFLLINIKKCYNFFFILLNQ